MKDQHIEDIESQLLAIERKSLPDFSEKEKREIIEKLLSNLGLGF